MKTTAERNQESEKKAAAMREVRARLSAAFSTEDGLFALRYLIAICGQFDSSIVLSAQQEVNAFSTVANEARRSVYLDLRRMVRADIVKKAEARQHKGAGK